MTVMSKMHWTNARIITLFVIAAFFICGFIYCSFSGLRLGKYHNDLVEPSMLLIRRLSEGEKTYTTEYVAIIPLQDIITIDKMLSMRELGGMPPRYSIGREGEKFSLLIAVPLRLDENTYRINVLCDGELFVFDNIKYNGESYLTVAKGTDWLIAISKRI